MRTAICFLLALGLALGEASVVRNEGSSRALLASASATSSASAKDGASASSIAKSVATGNVKAISEAISEANAGGDATAISEALADEYSTGSSRRKNAIAKALASALDFSEDEANKALEGGAKNVAEAIATSRGGTTEAAARSVSEAVAESKDAIAKALVTSFSTVNGGGDAEAAANVAATAIGTATAQAYASAEITLNVEGDGEASALAFASAEAVASATATVIAEGAVSAANQFNKRSASLKKEVVTEAIARAAADAYVKGVQDGKGSVSANQESIGEAIAKPISRVVFSLIAIAFGEEDADVGVFVEEVTSDVEDEATAQTIDNATTTDVGGDVGTFGNASASANLACTGLVKFTCCGQRAKDGKSDKCRCSLADPTSCRAYREESDKKGFTTVWRVAATGDNCACP